MRTRYFCIVSGLFIVLTLQAVYPAVSLYVRNQPYAKPLYESGGTLYALADDIFPVVRLMIKVQGRVLCGATPNYKGPLCPKTSANSFLYVDGKPITAGVIVRHDKVWISVPVLAKAIGYSYKYNHSTGIADLFTAAAPRYVAVPISPSLSPKNAPKGESGKSSSKEAKSSDSETSVDVQNLSHMQDSNTYEVRVYFDVKNTGKHAAKGVIATLNYLDGNGNPIVSRSYNIGTLAAGDVVHENDYWINTTHIYSIQPQVQLDWEGKKKG